MHKFYGQFDPPVDQFIFERYFPDTNIEGVFVECGAFDGLTECSCKFFEESLGWKGYSLEPVPWIFDSLQKNRPTSNNLNFALSNRDAEINFRAVVHPTFGRDCTNGSIFHLPRHKEILADIGCIYEDVTVKAITWKSLVDLMRLSVVDLFVLDVEGHELEVLEGMLGAAVLPFIMCVEFGHIGLQVIRTAMDRLGYIYDITSNGNAYFIRKDMVDLVAFRSIKSHKCIGAVSSSAEILSSNIESSSFHTENAYLKMRVQELEQLYHAVTFSKSWRFIQSLKTLLGRHG